MSKNKNYYKDNGPDPRRPETADDIIEKVAAEEAETDRTETEKEETETGSEKAGTDKAGSDKADGANEPEAGEMAEENGDAEAPANEWKDKYTRQLAEFDNFRKRTEKEKSQMYDMGAKTIAEKILPTIDNFERGLQNAPDDAFAEGMQMVYKQLLKNLEDAGVKAIECVGKEFDPNIHNAVMHEEDDSGEENIVTEELQKGYMYKDSLLRPSMVKVKN